MFTAKAKNLAADSSEGSNSMRPLNKLMMIEDMQFNILNSMSSSMLLGNLLQ